VCLQETDGPVPKALISKRKQQIDRIRRMDRHTRGSTGDWEVKNVRSAPLASQPPLERALADDDVREFVSCTVRRAVPAVDAEDVAQAVFCDALETTTLPSNPLEIPFWLVGIARNRVVDYFRRRPRELADAAADLETAPASFESREALGHVLARVGDDAQARRTLSWMVAEHDGVPLKTIARTENLSPAAVRARVYRLRATLRRELAYLLAGLFLVVGIGAALRERWRPQPAVAGEGSVVGVPAWIEGDFEVAAATLASDLDLPERMAFELQATGAKISIRGARLEVRTAMMHGVRSLSFAPGEGKTLTVAVADETGAAQTLTVERVGERLLVQSTTGRLRGMLLLRRTGP
jgi:DNA-directed RNA polymerase specialized sigma24 family protein